MTKYSKDGGFPTDYGVNFIRAVNLSYFQRHLVLFILLYNVVTICILLRLQFSYLIVIITYLSTLVAFNQFDL